MSATTDQQVDTHTQTEKRLRDRLRGECRSRTSTQFKFAFLSTNIIIEILYTCLLHCKTDDQQKKKKWEKKGKRRIGTEGDWRNVVSSSAHQPTSECVQMKPSA